MALLNITSPHAYSPKSTADVMKLVIIATLPGFICMSWFFGWGTFINIVIAAITALGCEATVMRLRQRPVMFYLRDYSALVTAVLLGLSLPPLAPWWIVVIGTAFAIVVAKHLYGGMGYNPFNPAMVGYVVLLISFPVQMTAWPAPYPLLPEGTSNPGLWASLQTVFPFLGSQAVDAVTAATPLDTLKHSTGLLVEHIYQTNPVFVQGEWAGVGWEWVNLGFLTGGIFLLYKKVFTWHAPVCMLASLVVMSALFYDGGSSSSHGSPQFHLLSGATMLGAFFIVTDPVSSATSTLGRMIYGAAIGVLVFVIRSWGSYPDAVAFSVLLMNFAAPLIDNYTLPRTYGHDKRPMATKKSDPEEAPDAD